MSCAVVALALAGCWPVPGQNADRTAFNDVETALTPASVGGLRQRWAATIGVTSFLPSAVVSPDGVHVALRCRLTTLDPASGAVRWSVDTFPGGGAWCAGNGGGGAGTTTAGDSGPPFVVDGTVHVGSGRSESGPSGGWGTCDGVTVGVDAATGAHRSLTTTGLVLAVRGRTAVGGDCTVDATGTPRFDLTTGALGTAWTGLGVAELIQDANATTLGQGAVYVSGEGLLSGAPGSTARGEGTRAYALSGPSTGCGVAGAERCPLWAVPAVTGGPPVLGDGGSTLYVAADADGAVTALDAATGAVRWTGPPTGSRYAGPALARGVLYAPTATGGVVALDAATGAVRWRGATGSEAGASVQAVVAGGVVFVGLHDGGVHAFDAAGCGGAATCAPLWSAATGDAPVTGGLAVSGGRLYVPTGAGRLVAYALA
jgi:outer membrane protein assembly factor BamB